MVVIGETGESSLVSCFIVSNSGRPVFLEQDAMPKFGRQSKRESSKKRRAEILRAALDLLVDGGYDQLALRKVAEASGIHLKTLQHYFPTKEILIQAVLEYANSLYDRTYEDFGVENTDNLELHFEKYILFLIEDTKNPKTTGFFYQLWARANIDSQTNDVMQKMYAHHSKNIEKLMIPLCPDMPDNMRYKRAVMIAALIEGMMLFIGHGKSRPDGAESIEEEVLTLAKRLASDVSVLEGEA